MSPARAIVTLLIAGSVLSGIHYYLWARLVRDTAAPAPWAAIGAWGLRGLVALMLLGVVLVRYVPRRVGSPLLWVSYTWLGLMFFLFVLLLVGDIGRLVVGRLAPDVVSDPERRTFLARAIAAGSGLLALALVGVGARNVAREVAVKTLRIALPRWSPKLAGYTIVQLTDIHVGPTIGKEFIDSLVARVNALDPDLVVITGDLVDGTVEQLGAFVAPLANLRSKDGTYFVVGNHEYYSGVGEWVSFLETLGIRTLLNERVRIGGDQGFDLAGVDDPTGAPDLAAALRGRDPTRAVVLLAHQPKAVLEAARHGVDLQLSGHTHGGQLFPFHGVVRLAQPYVAGLHDHEGTKIYVSCGTGYWGPPMRVGAPAEITRIELSPA